MMKRLSLILLFLLLSFSIAGCKVAKTTTTTTNQSIEPFKEFVGVKITLMDKPSYENPNYVHDYYYIGEDLSPYIYDLKINEYIDDENAEVTEYHIYYHMTPKYYCFTYSILIKENDEIVEHEQLIPHCTYGQVISQVTRSINYGYKVNDINKKIIFKVTFTPMPELISYTVTEFNDNNEKINTTTITLDDLDDLHQEIILSDDTAYCIINYEYNDNIVATPKTDTKIIGRNTIIKGYTHRIYTVINDGERAYYDITIKYEE